MMERLPAFIERYKEMAGQFLRFGIVGVVATAVHYGIYCLLLSFWSHNLSYTVGYFLSFIMNYLLTKYWYPESLCPRPRLLHLHSNQLPDGSLGDEKVREVVGIK